MVDRKASPAVVHRVTNNWARLSDWTELICVDLSLSVISLPLLWWSVSIPVSHDLDYCSNPNFIILFFLYYSLKSGTEMPLALSFSLRIYLAIQSPLWFHTNFRIVCSIALKTAIGILRGMALNLYIALNSTVTVTILLLPFDEHGIFFHGYVCFCCFLSASYRLLCICPSPSWLNWLPDALFCFM